MDYTRRETLALGSGVAAGLLAGGVIGAGARRDGTPAVGGDDGGPMRWIAGTWDGQTVEVACDAVVGEERVVTRRPAHARCRAA